MTSPRRERDFGVAAAGVRLVQLPTFTDHRGSVSVAELAEVVPFDIRRAFFVFDVPGAEVRGEHAHRRCHQLLVAVHGSCSVEVDDGSRRGAVTLDSPSVALHIPPMVWAVQHRHEPGTVLLVLASHAYDPDDYVRDYHEFLRLVGR